MAYWPLDTLLAIRDIFFSFAMPKATLVVLAEGRDTALPHIHTLRHMPGYAAYALGLRHAITSLRYYIELRRIRIMIRYADAATYDVSTLLSYAMILMVEEHAGAIAATYSHVTPVH